LREITTKKEGGWGEEAKWLFVTLRSRIWKNAGTDVPKWEAPKGLKERT